MARHGWNCFMGLMRCVLSDPLVRNMRVFIWKALDKLANIIRQHSITNDDVQLLKNALVKFTQAMVEGWDETHITHYMFRQIFKSNFLLQ